MLKKRIFNSFTLTNKRIFQKKLLHWAEKTFLNYCLLDSNEYKNDKYSDCSLVFAAGEYKSLLIDSDNKNAFDELKKFSDGIDDWIFGFFSYDLKNQLENLSSNNIDGIKMPLLYFFQPLIIILLNDDKVEIGTFQNGEWKPTEVFASINKEEDTPSPMTHSVNILARINKAAYTDVVNKIKAHIQKGDVYEMNYCFEFFDENAVVDPVESFIKLNSISPSPFASFFKYHTKYLMCSSPERFIKKKGNKLISQPIKGTIGRGATEEEDRILAEKLFNDPKERSENVMIVDLVRNDLSKSAVKNSVEVEELFGIYKFAKVQQMISTISSELNNQTHYIDAIKYAFPMGSMTGAPKVKSMELAEKLEHTKRGLYSGAVGYFSPAKDFDFNVVIRSILYCSKNTYLSYMVGSAITISSMPENEYEECLLKAKSMAEVFGF